MATKFALDLKTPQLRLASKGILIGGASLWFFENPSLFAGLLFVGISLGAYMKPLFRPRTMMGTFMVLLALAVLIAEPINGRGWSFMISVSVGFMGSLIIGIKDLVIVRREAAHELVVGALFAILAALSPSSILVWCGATLLVKELLETRWTIALAVGFLMFELNIFLSMVSLAPFSRGALLLMGVFALVYLIRHTPKIKDVLTATSIGVAMLIALVAGTLTY